MARRVMVSRVFAGRVFATWALRAVQGPVGPGWTVPSRSRLAVSESKNRLWTVKSGESQ